MSAFYLHHFLVAYRPWWQCTRWWTESSHIFAIYWLCVADVCTSKFNVIGHSQTLASTRGSGYAGLNLMRSNSSACITCAHYFSFLTHLSLMNISSWPYWIICTGTNGKLPFAASMYTNVQCFKTVVLSVLSLRTVRGQETTWWEN